MNFTNFCSKVYLSRAQTRAMAKDEPIGDPFGGPAFGERNDPVSTIVAASAGANLLGGAMGANAAENAAYAQAEAANNATAQQASQYNQSRSDLAPWRDSGGDAIQRLRVLLGLGENKGSADFGSLNRRFTLADFEADPVNQLGFQFGLDEGSKALRRMYGANGMGRSGAAAKALTRFGTDYARSKAGESRARFLQDQDITFNRLSGVAGTGQTATTNTAQLGANYATNVGNNLIGAANARGASEIAGANAYGGALSNIGNNVTSAYLMNSMNRSPSGGYSSPRFILDDSMSHLG